MKMKLLMIVGQADDIFIVNMAKWLKKTMDIEIDIIAHTQDKNSQTDDVSYYHSVDIMSQRFLFETIPFVRRFTLDWDKNRKLRKLLKGRYYDIIHCHFIAGMLAGADFLKNHCKKLYFTFWGGETQRSKYWGSNKIFRKKFTNILRKYSDGIVNGGIGLSKKWSDGDWIPTIYYGSFGSSSIDYLYDMMQKSTKENAKTYYNIPVNKVSVQICYSGKPIHRQFEIIECLIKKPELIPYIHIVAPMTRGADATFVEDLENRLKNSGYSYTIIKDRFLTDVEIATLRFAVDVVLQLSIWDGYSRSIIECLCAGSILIYGDWLNYRLPFQKDGFSGEEVRSIDKAVEKLNEYIKFTDKYKTMIETNQFVGKTKYRWAECIKDWKAVYEGTANVIS